MHPETPPQNDGFQEVHFRVDKKTKPFYTKYYLTPEQRRQLIRDVSDSGVLLLEYYMRQAGFDDQTIKDSDAAEYLGWDLRKVSRVRQQLQAADWYNRSRINYTDGRKGYTYYIGFDVVQKYCRRHK